MARSEFSRAELRIKLLPHIREGEDVDAVLDELEQCNWLSDERALGLAVQHRRSRYGTLRITHELRQKGIAEELINAALPSLKESELTVAQEVWKKKFHELPHDTKERAKQIRFLQARGFGFDVISHVLSCEIEGEVL